MNIDLVKKYKKEFDHLINGGNLLYKTRSKEEWP